MRLGVVLLVLVLAGCATLPRGAGIEREVLKQPEGAGKAGVAADFGVEPVTRASLPVLAGWPAVGEPGLGWIERVDQPNNRIIAPGDSLEVTIWTTEDNALLTPPGQRFVTLPEMRVSPGGSIFLPYIGDMKVSGMAPETARARIEERYVEVTPSAQIQIAMTEGRLSTVSLVGGVGKPGPFPLPDQDYTVLDLLAAGGGVAPGIGNPQIRLQRDGRIFGTSVARLMANPRLDTTLRGGDKVFVEPDRRQFLSLGAAGTEAVHDFPQDNVSALEAMSLIGGLAETRANARGILILRQYPAAAVRADGSGPSHARMVFTLDLTSADGLFSAGRFPIRSGDLVYVTESPITSTRLIFSLIGSVFGLANQAGSVGN